MKVSSLIIKSSSSPTHQITNASLVLGSEEAYLPVSAPFKACGFPLQNIKNMVQASLTENVHENKKFIILIISIFIYFNFNKLIKYNIFNALKTLYFIAYNMKYNIFLIFFQYKLKKIFCLIFIYHNDYNFIICLNCIIKKLKNYVPFFLCS